MTGPLPAGWEADEEFGVRHAGWARWLWYGDAGLRASVRRFEDGSIQARVLVEQDGAWGDPHPRAALPGWRAVVAMVEWLVPIEARP